MTTNLIDLADKTAKDYEYLERCPQCGVDYFALFDKMFIDNMGFCYWPCGNSRPEVERAADNILELIRTRA